MGHTEHGHLFFLVSYFTWNVQFSRHVLPHSWVEVHSLCGRHVDLVLRPTIINESNEQNKVEILPKLLHLRWRSSTTLALISCMQP